MAYYHECEICGVNLDPGERCDCQQKEKTAPDAVTSDSGQSKN
jgi:hypothetical protein